MVQQLNNFFFTVAPAIATMACVMLLPARAGNLQKEGIGRAV